MVFAQSVPAWVTVVVAVISGGAAVLGAYVTALFAGRRQERELRQARELEGAEARRQALDAAAALGIDYRERVALALREIEGVSHKPTGGVEPLRSLSREDTIVFRRTLATLILRFGPGDDVTLKWQQFAGALVEAAGLAKDAESRLNSAPAATRNELATEARRRRQAARQALDAYLVAAADAVRHSADAVARDALLEADPSRVTRLRRDPTGPKSA